MRLPKIAWPAGAPLPSGAQVRDGSLEIYSDDVRRTLEHLERVGADLNGLRVETPNLEDLFLKLTGHTLRA